MTQGLSDAENTSPLGQQVLDRARWLELLGNEGQLTPEALNAASQQLADAKPLSSMQARQLSSRGLRIGEVVKGYFRAATQRVVAAEHGTWQPSSEEQSGISGVMRQRLRTLNARIERVNQDQLQLEEARHSLEQRESVLRQGEFKLLQWELVHEKEELQTARLSKLRASKDELEKQISLAHSHFDIELKKLKYEVDRALLCGTELHEVDQLMDSLSGHQLWQSVPGLSLHSETALFDRSMGYIEEMRDASRDDHQRLIAAAAVLATSTMMWRKHIHTLFLLDVHLENMVRTLIQCDSLLRLISPNASQRELVALRLEQHKALLPEPVHSRYEMTFKKWSGLMELSYPRAYGAPLGGVPNGMRAA